MIKSNSHKVMQKVVKKARQRLADYIAVLPAPLDALADKYTRSPSDDGLPGGRLGERYAFWIGELFSIDDEEVLGVATFGCILGCAYAVLQDDRIDNPQKNHVETEALGNLFLVKAVESLHSLAPDNPQFWCYLHRYLEDLSVAYLWEVKEHHRRFKNFDARDVRMAADRSAPLNACVATLALYADKECEVENVTEAMRHIIFGLQIRDDLTDWREDFRQGNWTYPINLAIEHLQQGGISFNPQSFQEHEMENALFLSDIVERLFEESTINFQLAKEKLAHLNSRALCEYLDAMIANNEKTKMTTISAKMEALLQWNLIPLEETCSDKNLFQT